MTSKLKAVPADEPDIVAAEALSIAIAAFNRHAGQRSTLAIEDREQLDRVKDSIDRFAAATFAGTHPLWNEMIGHQRDAQQARNGIVDRAKRYVKTTTGNQTLVVDGEEIGGIPAIESAAVRIHIQRLGTELIADIDQYVAERRSAFRRAADHAKAADDFLAAAEKVPMLGAALGIYRELAQDRRGGPTDVRFGGALNEAAVLIGTLCDIQSGLLPKGVDVRETLVEILIRQLREAAAA